MEDPLPPVIYAKTIPYSDDTKDILCSRTLHHDKNLLQWAMKIEVTYWGKR